MVILKIKIFCYSNFPNDKIAFATFAQNSAE